MRRNDKKKTILIILMSLLVQFGFSQKNIRIPTNLYKSYSDKENGNALLSASLSTNNCDSVFLNLTNLTNDTIMVVGYFMLEWPKEAPYILFCLSDSLLRKESSESGFDFHDIDFYSYSARYLDQVDPVTNHANFQRLIICDKEQANQNKCYVEVFPRRNILIPVGYYFEDKYLFLRFQSRVCLKRNWFWIQKETNSVFMPICIR